MQYVPYIRTARDFHFIIYFLSVGIVDSDIVIREQQNINVYNNSKINISDHSVIRIEFLIYDDNFLIFL